MDEIKSDENLLTAFAGESQANRRYLFFADRAEKDGQPQIARLFRAAAEAETVHARNHFGAMDALGSTKDNLLAAVMGEHYEFTRMYPPFIDQAEREENQRARVAFESANEVEQIHHGLFQQALKAFEAGEQLKDEPYFVCPVCGNTIGGEAPERCPICHTAGDKFKRVD